MARFEEYLEKTEPEDTDISVLYDGDENATKKFSLGNLVKWMLNRAKIGLLETNAKTVTDSINEVNTRAKTNTARIEAIEKNPVKSENLNGQVFGLAWIYWTNNLVTGDGLENDAITYSKHDIIATQCLHLDKLASSKPTLTSDSIIILKRAKELNPKLRHFEYIQSDSGRIDFSYNGDHAHLNPNGSWEGSTADLSGSSRIYTFAQFCDWFDWVKKQGADGVFFDDWGYEVLNLVNEERAKYNVAPLKWDDSLAALAESHCEDMIDRNFFAHNTPDGQTPFDRMKAAGISYSSAGENIAAGQSSPQNVMDSWMNSPGHRKNILNPDFEYIGVGLARGGSYGIYWAQEFATFK